VSPIDRPPGHRLVPGAPVSPVILHAPHGSRLIPAGPRRALLLDDAGLSAELDHMTDSHTDTIAVEAARGARRTPWVFVNLLSRLVVDPERLPDDEMRAVGMGAVYTRTSHRAPLRADDADHAERLLRTYFAPYAQAMTDLVDERLAATGRAVIIDVHSYPSVALPYELHGAGPRPAVCLGTHPAHTPPDLLAAARWAFAGCGDIGENTPFAGCYVPLKHFGSDAAVTALMVEVRRDTYMVEPGGPPTAGLARIIHGLVRLVDAVSDRG
jgi:N-formylglutamate amidohydrolase